MQTIFQRGIRWAAVAVIVALAGSGVVACVNPDEGTPLSGPGEPDTVWLQTLARTGPDGTLDRPTALQAFTLAIAPVPGVPRPSGAAAVIPSGTAAVTEVLRHFAELTDDERGAVVAGLDPTASGSTRTSSRNPVLPCHTSDSAGAAQYREMADDAIRKIAMGLGHQPDVPVHLVINPREVSDDGTKARAYTYMCHGTQQSTDTLRVTGCTIHMNPVAVAAGLPDGETRAIITHEVAHCFLRARLFTRSPAQPDPPLWFTEGAATWIMTQLAPSAVGGGKWREYLDSPALPLFRRSYSGVGFFAHLAETGKDVWHLLDPMIDAQPGPADPMGWNKAAWQVADPGPAFLDSWGSGFAQGRYPGTAWTSTGPGLPAYLPALPRAALSDGGSTAVSAEAAGTAVTVVHVDAQIVLVGASSGAHGRVSLGGGRDVTFPEASVKPWCTLDSSQCRCPGDNDTEFGSMTSGEVYVSVAGGLSPAQVTLAGQSREEFCKKREKSVGKKGTVPTECPSVTVIAKGFPRPAVNAGPWEFDGDVIPPGALPKGWKTCGYSAWLGAKDPVTGFQQVEQVELTLIPDPEPTPADARQVTIPGTDRAWFAGILKVVGNGRELAVGLRIRTTEDQDATTIAVAKAVLGFV